MAATVSAMGSDWAGGAKPDRTPAPEPDGSGDRAHGAGVAAGARALGTAEVEARVGTRPVGASLAGGEYDRGVAEAGRAGGGAQEAAQNDALQRTAGACRWAEPGVVRGLQGLVSHGERRTHRSADDQRRAQPLLVALSSGGEDGHRSEEHTSELQSLRHLVCRLL